MVMVTVWWSITAGETIIAVMYLSINHRNASEIESYIPDIDQNEGAIVLHDNGHSQRTTDTVEVGV